MLPGMVEDEEPNTTDILDGGDITLSAAGARIGEMSFHPWYAVRPAGYALAATAFTVVPVNSPVHEVATAVEQLNYRLLKAMTAEDGANGGRARVVDLCSGIGTIAAAASMIGCSATAVEIEPVAVLAGRLLVQWGADPALALVRSHSRWRGLAAEIAAAGEDVLSSIGAAFRCLEPDRREQAYDRIWARSVRCPSCHLLVPMISDTRLSPDLRLDVKMADKGFVEVRATARGGDTTWKRGELACPRCHHRSRVTLASATHALPLLDVGMAEGGRIFVEVVDGDPFEFPEASDGADDATMDVDDPGTTWSWDARGKPIRLDHAHTPRQLEYFRDAIAAIRSAVDGIDPRESPANAVAAVGSGLALLLSAQVPGASTYATWDWRRQVPVPGNRRHAWAEPSLFVEAGLHTLATWWRQRTKRLCEQLTFNSEHLESPVAVVLQDASSSGLTEAHADAVVWDPPAYDNIDYAVMARPHDVVLSGLRDVLPADVSHALSLPRERSRFDRDAYISNIRQQAAEARRLVKSTGRVGLFWPVRDPSGLQQVLDMIAPVGLELERIVRISRQGSLVDPSFTYILVMRPVGAAATSSRSHASAERVLTLADEGKPSLYQALADLLLENWDDEDVEALVPSDFRGTHLDRVAEMLASHSNLEDLLVELGRGTLRRELERLDPSGERGRGDARAMAAAVLRTVGFDVPEPLGFSIGEAVLDADRASGLLRYAHSKEEARGAFSTVVMQVERVLRYSTIAWAQTRGPDWPGMLDQLLVKASGKSFDVRTSSFGDWQAMFTELPKQLQGEGHSPQVFGPIAGSMRKAKSVERLSGLLKARNGIGHDHQNLAELRTDEFAGHLLRVSTSVIQMLDRLNSEGRLPVTLRPFEEIRDHYGRRRLVLIDSQGVRTEVFVGKETDLTRPLIYIQSGNYPRDVSPLLLPSGDVDAVLGFGGGIGA